MTNVRGVWMRVLQGALGKGCNHVVFMSGENSEVISSAVSLFSEGLILPPVLL